MDTGGWDVRTCDLCDPSTGALDDYLSKVARETTSSNAKEGRDGSFSMFGLLREVIASYEYAAFGAWEELERTVSGKRVRFLTWSKGAQAIRARAGHARALTDEEIAATDMGGDDLIAIDPDDWPKLQVLLEVFFGAGERDGAARGRGVAHLKRYRLVPGDTRAAATAPPTTAPACATAA